MFFLPVVVLEEDCDLDHVLENDCLERAGLLRSSFHQRSVRQAYEDLKKYLSVEK